VNIWAIVPVKPLNRAKSRLSSVLDASDREALSKGMLEHTLLTLSQVRGIAGTLLISRDTAALALARNYGAQTVQETGDTELISSLTRATQVVSTWNAGGILIVAADIPFMTVKDVEDMLALAKNGPNPTCMVIAPDRHHNGTNAMLVIPPNQFAYRYGEGSFEKHCQAAQESGAAIHVFESPTLGLDIDVPEDLTLYQTMIEQERSNNGHLHQRTFEQPSEEVPKG
jgi:2-phospho-L-lactate guanylyltransferase